ncbi:hypothetical protein WKV44_06690 [Spirochaetia bacterium 38H-sp]|uniref:Phage protein n=1 Tax=Rarispira pelagica TaxID=3141764 RepID=A0ABU9UC35_9SPIR
MKEREDIELLLETTKKLVSAIEGAPYPQHIKNELYDIWYENAVIKVGEALYVLNTMFGKYHSRYADDEQEDK